VLVRYMGGWNVTRPLVAGSGWRIRRFLVCFAFVSVTLAACEPSQEGLGGKLRPSATGKTSLDNRSRPIEVADIPTLRPKMSTGRVILVGRVAWYGLHGWLLEDRRCPLPRADDDISCPVVRLDTASAPASAELRRLEDLVYSSKGIGGVRTTDTVVEVEIEFVRARPETIGALVSLVRVVDPGTGL